MPAGRPGLALLSDFAADDFDDSFEFGLGCLFDGLAAKLAAQR